MLAITNSKFPVSLNVMMRETLLLRERLAYTIDFALPTPLVRQRGVRHDILVAKNG